VLERMRTGWKPQVESPWQTTWEDLPDKGGSKAHMYGMVPGYFLTAHVLGARRAGIRQGPFHPHRATLRRTGVGAGQSL
jgi:hypothetical protein